jgi:glycerophosphoryl diester phosphodiesterase
VWTIDELDDVEVARKCGVDAIITDRPAETLAALGRADLP